MRTLRAWMLRITGLFGKRRRDRELSAEIESNLDLHIQDNLRAGMTPREARRQALIKLGGGRVSERKLPRTPWPPLPGNDVAGHSLRIPHAAQIAGIHHSCCPHSSCRISR